MLFDKIRKYREIKSAEKQKAIEEKIAYKNFIELEDIADNYDEEDLKEQRREKDFWRVKRILERFAREEEVERR